MAQKTLEIRGSAPPAPARDDERVGELELQILHLEEEVARLKRERMETELMGRRAVAALEPEARAELARRLETRDPLPQVLRDGELLPPAAVPPEAVLDLDEVFAWRHALAAARGLATLLYLRDGEVLVPAANEPSQLPALAGLTPACRRCLDETVEARGPRPHALRLTCSGCGGEVWAEPILLRHGADAAVLGCLAAHAAPQAVAAHRRLLALVAARAGGRAADVYARQVAVVADRRALGVVRSFTEAQAETVRRARIAMLERDRTAQELARARESLERALQDAGAARREAERANRVKSLFLASMSHEIRTPLTCVIGFADLLTLPSLSEAEIRQFARSIKESGQILMSLINNVLDLSKVEAGRLELEHIPFSPAKVLKEVHTIFLGSTADKGLEFRLEVDPEVPAQLLGDPTRVRQVVMNLVSNAVKFTQQGGVWLRCAPSPEAPDFLLLTVRDTGPGMTADQLPHVFDAFRQADAGVGRRHGGTGLGLAISQRIMEEMGGSLSVASEPGVGTVFRCHLPVRRPEDDSSLPPATTAR